MKMETISEYVINIYTSRFLFYICPLQMFCHRVLIILKDEAATNITFYLVNAEASGQTASPNFQSLCLTSLSPHHCRVKGL